MKKSILKFPHITEKASAAQGEFNKYTFVVDRSANKFEIKQAVEGLKKGIRVENVSTQIMRGKVKRIGISQGKRSNWKKAVVQLKEGQTLDLVESV